MKLPTVVKPLEKPINAVLENRYVKVACRALWNATWIAVVPAVTAVVMGIFKIPLVYPLAGMAAAVFATRIIIVVAKEFEWTPVLEMQRILFEFWNRYAIVIGFIGLTFCVAMSFLVPALAAVGAVALGITLALVVDSAIAYKGQQKQREIVMSQWDETAATLV